MSITLNNSDFQCLQDQLVDLKTKNYELAEKTRRSQADFEAAKAKICTLQLKLEEQEREFQITSTTLRREIEAISNQNEIKVSNDNLTSANAQADKENKDEDYKAKYKKLLHKAKELQQRYEKSVEVVQQIDNQNKSLNERVRKLEEENSKLREDIKESQKKLDSIGQEHQRELERAIEELKSLTKDDNEQNIAKLESITAERETLLLEIDRLTKEVSRFDQRLESEAEERKINERKGSQIVKELKRQLALEKNCTETLQKRLEHLLSAPTVPSADIEASNRLSVSSSTNGNGSNGNGSRANQDANSVSSWSFVAGKAKSTEVGANETTMSFCSMGSEDRETVQQPCDNTSDDSLQFGASQDGTSGKIPSTTTDETSTSSKHVSPRPTISSESVKQNFDSTAYQPSDNMSMEDQVALVDRLTKLQHDKWMLEEKLSYMEQANSTLSEDLANKSDIIKQYFMDQAMKAVSINHNNQSDNIGGLTNTSGNRRASLTNNVNHLLSDKPSLKKMVNFIKDKSQMAASETENVSREATKRMQLMLEETLIKCQKLQENLDHVTYELNKYKS